MSFDPVAFEQAFARAPKNHQQVIRRLLELEPDAAPAPGSPSDALPPATLSAESLDAIMGTLALVRGGIGVINSLADHKTSDEELDDAVDWFGLAHLTRQLCKALEGKQMYELHLGLARRRADLRLAAQRASVTLEDNGGAK